MTYRTTAMSKSKLITVFGATGNQGGSLIEAIIEDGTFSVRGVTRNTDSDIALALKKKGVEIVYADYDDPLTLDTVMVDSYGVYVVTGAYLEKFYENKEVARGQALVNAAIRAGVQHFVYSGLPPCKTLIGQPCPEFDGKSRVEEFMFAAGLPSTSVRMPVNMENILIDFIPVRQPDGTFVWNMPMEGKVLPMMSSSQDGRAILTVFKNPKEFIGTRLGLAGDCKTVEEYAAIASKHVAPYIVKPTTMSVKEFKKLDLSRAEDLGTMFEFYQVDNSDFSVENTKRLDSKSVNFDCFMRANASKLKKLLECQNGHK